MTIKNSEIISNVVENANEIQELRLRLEEAEETLRAIREGEVDGLIINSGQGEQIFTLVGADHSYRMLIEAMNEGALTLTADGIILYCNLSFAKMMKIPQQELIGSSFFNLLYPSDLCNLQGSIARSEGVMRREIDLLRGDDSPLPVHLSMNSMLVEGKEILSLVITNLTEMKERASELQLANTQLHQEIKDHKEAERKLLLNQQRMEALEKLNNMVLATKSEITEFAYQVAIKLTNSDIGWLGFINEDETESYIFSWSDSVMANCKLDDKIMTFPVADSGLWAEAIRQRRPILINDYSAPHHHKNGLPDGHAELIRLLVVPIFDGDHIIAVISVANKDEEYDDTDILQLSLLIGAVWKIIQHREAVGALRRSEQKTTNILESISDAFYSLDREWRFTYINGEARRQMGVSDASEVIGKVLWDTFPKHTDLTYESFHKAMAEQTSVCLEQYSHVTGRWHYSNAYPSPDGLSVYFLDITDFKETQLELQKSQQDIADILSSISDPFWVIDDQWRIAYINQAAASYIGKPQEELVGRNYHDVLPGLVDSDIYEKYCRVMFGRVPMHFESMGVKLKSWYNFSVYPCQTGIAIYAHDITEKKQLEAAMIQSEERFNKAFHSSLTMMAITNMKDGRYMDVNPAWLDVLGFSRSDVIGRTSKDLNIYVAPKQREDVYQYLEESNKLYDVEIQLRTKGGDILTTIASAEIIELGGDRCMLSNTFNITLRKAAEEAMRQSEEKFSKAFHGMPIMMTLATVEDGRFLDANDALCSGTGYSYEEIIGHTSIELNLFPHRIRPDLAVRLVKERRLENYEADLLTKSGEMRNCLCWSQVLHVDRELCHITGMIDVTEQKRVEKEFVRLDRLNLIGEMAGSIGHEIRNPMTAVRGFIQLLNEQECYKKDEIYFDLMIEELDRANGIISEYLGVAKDKPIDLQPQHLNQVINEIYPLIEADANYKGINIKLYLGKPAITRIDKNEIRQLLLNIARNGMEAMSTGGTLTIGTTLAESEIVLFIKDEGQGLPPELLDKLGTPFVTTKENGTGLGLAVCYSIAARHNARMDYETGPTGTTFNIYFPSEDEQITLF